MQSYGFKQMDVKNANFPLFWVTQRFLCVLIDEHVCVCARMCVGQRTTSDSSFSYFSILLVFVFEFLR